MSAEDAGRTPNKDVCVSAHVFEVVELADGTRFLDICPADVPDDACRFTLLSLPGDREDVGDLRRYRDQNVTVRGIVRATHGRMGIVISHVRQFSGGPEKFRPNPKLLKNFNGQSDRMPVRDPNLAPTGVPAYGNEWRFSRESRPWPPFDTRFFSPVPPDEPPRASVANLPGTNWRCELPFHSSTLDGAVGHYVRLHPTMMNN